MPRLTTGFVSTPSGRIEPGPVEANGLLRSLVRQRVATTMTAAQNAVVTEAVKMQPLQSKPLLVCHNIIVLPLLNPMEASHFDTVAVVAFDCRCLCQQTPRISGSIGSPPRRRSRPHLLSRYRDGRTGGRRSPHVKCRHAVNKMRLVELVSTRPGACHQAWRFVALKRTRSGLCRSRTPASGSLSSAGSSSRRRMSWVGAPSRRCRMRVGPTDSRS